MSQDPVSPPVPGPAPVAPTAQPAATPPAATGPAVKPPPPPPDPAILALRDKVLPLLGAQASFELQGAIPAFRVPPANLHAAAATLRAEGFDYFLFMTAVDYPEQKRIELNYLLNRYEGAAQLALVADVSREDPRIDTVCDLWEAANWHERETYDLFGVRFTNHPDLRRILLDDTWEGYPLLKDYKDKGHDMVKRPY